MVCLFVRACVDALLVTPSAWQHHHQGSDDYIARLEKVVNKFVSTFPAEVEAAKSSAPAGEKLVGEAATAAADNFKNEGNDKLKARDFRGAIGAYSRVRAQPFFSLFCLFVLLLGFAAFV